jgi:hypothetical protein
VTAARAKPASRTRKAPAVTLRELGLRSGPRSRTGGPFDRPEVTSGPLTVRFDDLSAALVRFVDGSQVVVGCVAWLSHAAVLDALSRVQCAVVVQKEDYLRPVARDARYAATRRRYAALSNELRRSMLPAPLCSTLDPAHPRTGRLDPVRVVGTAGGGARGAVVPLMHHKFLVRAHLDGPARARTLVADAVWMGSANMTRNADGSLEFATQCDDPVVADAFLREFSRVAAISEPLAWTSKGPRPQWVLPTQRSAAAVPHMRAT